MEAMRQSWTDDRLDDFRGETARRFGEVDKRFDRVEGEIKDLRSEMNTRFDAMDARFDAMNARLDSLQRLMLWFCGAMIVTLLGVVLTQGWFMITQL